MPDQKEAIDVIRRNFVVLILSTLCMLLWTTASIAQVKPISNAVAYLSVLTNADLVTNGSGFIIHPSGTILTAKHVIRDAKSITVQIGSKTGAEAISVDMKSVNPYIENDVAIVSLMKSNKQYPCIALSTDWKPNPKDDSDLNVVLVGFPSGAAFAEPDGKLNTIKDENGHWVVNGLSDNGMSGGPVILKKSAKAFGVMVEKELSMPGGALQIITKVVPLNEKMKDVKSIAQSAGTDCDRTGEITMLASDGRAEVNIHGTGGGKITREGTRISSKFREGIHIEQSGGEISECKADYERKISTARASARVRPASSNDVNEGQNAMALAIDLNVSAQGGAFKMAPRNPFNNEERVCLGGIPFGGGTKDTDTWTEASAKAELLFSVTGGPRPAKIYWENFPTVEVVKKNKAIGMIELETLDGKTLEKWLANGKDEMTITLPGANTYRLTIDVRDFVDHRGMHDGPDSRKRSSIVGIK